MPPRRGAGGRGAQPRSDPRREGRRRAASSSSLGLLLLPFVQALQECLSHALAVGEHLAVARPPRLELDDLHVPRRVTVRMVVCLRLAEGAQPLLRLPAEETHHIRKTPNVVSGIGAFSAAERPSAST